MKELMEETADSGFGCAVANRFGQLLDDEADPFDILYKAQVENEKKKKKVEAKKTAAAAAAAASTAKTGKKESQRERKAFRAAGDVDNAPNARNTAGTASLRRPAHSQPEERVDKRAVSLTDAKPAGDDGSLGYSIERPVELFDRAARGRGGGRGRGARGGGYYRSADGFDPRGKREFERHSGSDRASVRPEEKRGGSGPRNWGSMRDHVSSAVVDVTPIEDTGESEEAPETAETDGENKPSETEEVIEVAIEMSLDEWKALQEQNRPKTEFNLRKAETKMPSKALVIHKSKRVEGRTNGMDDDSHLVCRRPTNDITFQLEINFGSLARPSRGGRGGRGGRGRGTSPAQRSAQKYNEAVPNPDDPEDFPALA